MSQHLLNNAIYGLNEHMYQTLASSKAPSWSLNAPLQMTNWSLIEILYQTLRSQILL